MKKCASDIHFEPYADFFRIRFRIDGILHEIAKPPTELAQYLIARLKILAELDIAEKRRPQDGRFNISYNKEGREVRVSTCPTLYGEKAVLRLLQTAHEIMSLANLGMDTTQQFTLEQALKQPQGMIVVTGPTGSGKTMSLYAALETLNTTSRNIVSIEDPIEIPLPGINQVQVNTSTDMTFNYALKTFLRQDPDVILVGEIRDAATAALALSAAQTGHLVLSTIHTNSALETVQRFNGLGISTRQVSTSVSLIIAQRLVRKLCPDCKRPSTATAGARIIPSEKKSLQTVATFEAVGCPECFAGYRGRIGLFEMIAPTQLNQAAITDTTTATQLATGYPYTTLHQAGWQRVNDGLTTIAELQRVLGS